MSETPTDAAANSGSTTDRLADAAHGSIDRLTPRANRAEADLRDTAARTAEGVRHLEEQARDTAREGLDKSRSVVAKNPLLCAGAAFAAGALLSVLIRR